MKKEEIRCKGTYRGEPCNRKLASGMPGFNMITNKAKIIEVKCPRCGAMNLISSEIVSSEILEKVIVKLKE